MFDIEKQITKAMKPLIEALQANTVALGRLATVMGHEGPAGATQGPVEATPTEAPQAEAAEAVPKGKTMRQTAREVLGEVLSRAAEAAMERGVEEIAKRAKKGTQTNGEVEA